MVRCSLPVSKGFHLLLNKEKWGLHQVWEDISCLGLSKDDEDSRSVIYCLQKYK